jgi:hypothetical protein
MACIQPNTGQMKNNVVYFGRSVSSPQQNTIYFMIPFRYEDFGSPPKDETEAMNEALRSTDETQINNISISITADHTVSADIPTTFGIIIGTGDVLKVSNQSPTYRTSLTLPANKTYVTQVFNNVNLEIPANSWIFVFFSFDNKMSEEHIYINVSFG